MAYHTYKHEATKYTLFYLLYRRKAQMPINIKFASKFNPIEKPYEQVLERRISLILRTFKDAIIIAECSIESAQERIKIQQNKLQQAHKFKIGDIIEALQATLIIGVNIQFLENKIKITHPNEDSSSTIIKETILPVSYQKKGPKIQDYVEKIFKASLNFDLEYLNEENTDNLLQALLKPNLSNRMKLFLYLKLENKFSELDKKIFLKKIEQKIQRNGPRILKIAFRASILYQEIGDYPIIKFKKITP
ncbi:1055_t:CDS:2, partial [Cetraspora pellucida]